MEQKSGEGGKKKRGEKENQIYAKCHEVKKGRKKKKKGGRGEKPDWIGGWGYKKKKKKKKKEKKKRGPDAWQALSVRAIAGGEKREKKEKGGTYNSAHQAQGGGQKIREEKEKKKKKKKKSGKGHAHLRAVYPHLIDTQKEEKGGGNPSPRKSASDVYTSWGKNIHRKRKKKA